MDPASGNGPDEPQGAQSPARSNAPGGLSPGLNAQGGQSPARSNAPGGQSPARSIAQGRESPARSLAGTANASGSPQRPGATPASPRQGSQSSPRALIPTMGLSRSPVLVTTPGPGSPRPQSAVERSMSALAAVTPARDPELGMTRAPEKHAAIPRLPDRGAEQDDDAEDPVSAGAWAVPNGAPSAATFVGEILATAVLLYLPAVLVWSTTAEAKYSLRDVTMYDPAATTEMEFVRAATVVCAAAVAAMLAVFLCTYVAAFLLGVMRVLGADPGVRVRRAVGHFVAARSAFAFLLWVACLAHIGGTYLYRGSASAVLTATFKRVFANRETAHAAAAVAQAEAQPDSDHSLLGLFEKGLFVLALWFSIAAVVRVATKLLAVGFQRTAFGARVAAANLRFRVVRDLVRAIRTPDAVAVPMAIRRGPLAADLELALLQDRRGILRDGDAGVESLAGEIFAAVAPTAAQIDAGVAPADGSAPKGITVESLGPFFGKDAARALSALDPETDGTVTLDSLRAALAGLRDERTGIVASMENNASIIATLEHVFLAVAAIVTLFLGAPILGLSFKSAGIVFGILWTSCGYLFKTTARSVFDALVFVFAEHAFDTGDTVVIDGETLTVERVRMLTTLFRRWDGTAVYMTNESLSRKFIVNIRRSGAQTQVLDLKLAAATAIDKIWALRDALATFCEAHARDFTGRVELVGYELVDAPAAEKPAGDKSAAEAGSTSEKVAVVHIGVEHASNAHDAAAHAARQALVAGALKDAASSLSLELLP